MVFIQIPLLCLLKSKTLPIFFSMINFFKKYISNLYRNRLILFYIVFTTHFILTGVFSPFIIVFCCQSSKNCRKFQSFINMNNSC